MSTKSEFVMKSQRRKKLFAVEQFGGKCQLCGYDKCINALSFHHLDPTTKKNSPSYIIMRWSWEKAFTELKKCILVCANCHAELHFNEKSVDLQVLAAQTFDKICVKCNTNFNTKLASQKYCGLECKTIATRKVKKTPTRDGLKRLLEQKTSWIEIGKIYGVSDNAIRKWAKKFQLI